MITGLFFYIILVAAVVFIANALDRNPIVFGAIALLLTPMSSFVALIVWHNLISPRK